MPSHCLAPASRGRRVANRRFDRLPGGAARSATGSLYRDDQYTNTAVILAR